MRRPRRHAPRCRHLWQAVHLRRPDHRRVGHRDRNPALGFMSCETAKSTEAERFDGLVGLNAFAGSVADMFLGYVDDVLRGLTVPLCDTRVGAHLPL